MAHMHHDVNYTIADQVRALVEETIDQQNQIIELQRDIRSLKVELKYSQKERQWLDKYSCGAIALLNIDKFFRRHVTYRDLPRYRMLVDCQLSRGTYICDMTRVLGRAWRLSWHRAKQFLHNGNCIVVFMQENDWGHFYLMTTDEYGCIIIVNRYPTIGCPCTKQVVPQAAANLLRHAHRTWYVKKGARLL